MFKLIKEFFQENGKGSSKRWIAISIAGVLAWSISYAITKAVTSSERYSIIVATMVFVLIMSGVATIPQIISLWKGGPAPKDDGTKEDTKILDKGSLPYSAPNDKTV